MTDDQDSGGSARQIQWGTSWGAGDNDGSHVLLGRIVEFDADGNPTRHLDVDATGTTDISDALNQWFNEPHGDLDLDLGIERGADTGVQNNYALFAEQFEHIHFISVDTAEFGRVEGIQLDVGKIDLGIYRDTVPSCHGWRALGFVLLRPWRWWRIPMVLRYWRGPR